MTKQKLDNKDFLNASAMKDYIRTLADRILAMIKKLSLHNQSRQHGHYDTQAINLSMEEILNTLGQSDVHSGSFQINRNIKEILTTHDPLLDFPSLNPY
eukprot:6189531-Pleurochrysis_carterae.AAC.2